MEGLSIYWVSKAATLSIRHLLSEVPSTVSGPQSRALGLLSFFSY